MKKRILSISMAVAMIVAFALFTVPSASAAIPISTSNTYVIANMSDYTRLTNDSSLLLCTPQDTLYANMLYKVEDRGNNNIVIYPYNDLSRVIAFNSSTGRLEVAGDSETPTHYKEIKMTRSSNSLIETYNLSAAALGSYKIGKSGTVVVAGPSASNDEWIFISVPELRMTGAERVWNGSSYNLRFTSSYPNTPSYPCIEFGTLMSTGLSEHIVYTNDADYIRKVPCTQYTVNNNTVTYSASVQEIPPEWYGRTYYARAYYIYRFPANGWSIYVYSNYMSRNVDMG